MRKLIVWLLLVVMLMMTPGAYAEESFSMAGYDDKDTKHDWTNNRFFDRMEERTGVTLDLQQYTTAAEWQAAKAAMLSGKMELPDALFKAALTPLETQEWYAAGKLRDLRELLPTHAPNLWQLLQSHPEWLSAVSLPTGEIVALPYIDELQFNNAMWINKAWLDAFSIDMPETAVELEMVLRYFRDHDMNGKNGSDDEIPLTFSSLWDLRFLLHAFGVNANDYYITMDETGKVSEILTTEENREFLSWVKMLWDEELLDRNGFNGSRSVVTPDKDADVVYGVMFASTPAELVHVSKVDQYVLLEPLKDKTGRQTYRDLTGDVIRGTFAITTACQNPEALLKWVDFLYTEEGFILAEAGMEGEEFSWIDENTWAWEDDAETLSQVTLPSATLRTGTPMPGVSSVSFQMKLEDTKTVAIAKALERLHEIDEMPYPMVWLTRDQQTRMDELILQIGSYAEQQMVWFICGDVPFTAREWDDFCETVRSLGVDEMVSIWQEAADAIK